ncbi:MAG: PepSY domain-containing protein [Sphingobacteriaceae bacterium]|nr:MAG: PepSY domain-containing protein [Sphingobacteriaceae bacterium]
MTPFKKTLLFIHRWLGFISGLVVVIVSITGCLFAFQDEIQDALYADYRKVEPQNKPYILPSQLTTIALKKYPAAKTTYYGYYGEDRPAVVGLDIPKVGTRYLYINPYNGKVLFSQDISKNFFIVVEYIHLYLLLPAEIGRVVVGTSVIIFVVMMITGIILWWPKRKSDRKRSFTIKWGGRWRRVNYDLHNVLGFYASSVAFILAITGLSIAFKWVDKGIYKTANLGKSYAYELEEPKSDSTKKHLAIINPMDVAFKYVKHNSPQAHMFFLHTDEKVQGHPITAYAYYKSMHYYKSDIYDFDQFSAKLMRFIPHQNKSAGLKMNAMNYDIHVGQILGLPGKIIAFLASLICASLPITGFIIWLGRRKKSKTNKAKEVVHHRTTKRQLAT